MDHIPLVSVVMTAYNGERFIVDTIKSIEEQTLEYFELIIIDDCSTDNTVAVIKKALINFNRPYQIIENKNNIGDALSRNIGNKIASGKFIAVADHDDISSSTRLEEEVNFLESEKSFDVCSGHMVEIAEDGQASTVTFTPPSGMRDIKKMFLLTCENPISHPACMYRKKTFFEMEGYDPSIPWCHDYDLWMKMIRHNKNMHNLQSTLIKYRVVKTSATHDSSTNMRRRAEVLFTMYRNGMLKSEWDEEKNGKYEFEYQEVGSKW